jgi:hypothetical protein
MTGKMRWSEARPRETLGFIHKPLENMENRCSGGFRPRSGQSQKRQGNVEFLAKKKPG